MKMIICGRDCEDCVHSNIDDTDKARIKVFCYARDREYFWGQCIPCEDFKKQPVKEEEL